MVLILQGVTYVKIFDIDMSIKFFGYFIRKKILLVSSNLTIFVI